jgi:tRNA(adenine34) deaminase
MRENSAEYWMEMAFREAQKAYEEGEVPIGAVVVFENRIIGKGYNLTEKLQDPTAHAEMIAITAAAEYLGSRRLLETTMYVTLEPCAKLRIWCMVLSIPNPAPVAPFTI